MTIGIDLDNTIVDYDMSFVAATRLLNPVFPESIITKHGIREHFRSQQNGEMIWQRLQGLVYGKFVISHAKLYPGVSRFLWRCAFNGVSVKVVSHKTEFGHFDTEKISLREAALSFLKEKGLMNKDKPLISEVVFKTTRHEKVQEIFAGRFDWFIDDLPEVISDLQEDKTLKKILFDPIGGQYALLNQVVQEQVITASDWQQIDTIINGEWRTEEVEELAYQLLGKKMTILEKIATGGNAGVFKLQVTEDKHTVKLKIYPVDAKHDRLRSEYLATQEITMAAAASVSPPLAKDDELGVGIYEWIEGERLTEHTLADVQAALDFLKALHQMRTSPQFADAPNASASCFRGIDIEKQIYNRLAQFSEVRITHHELDLFLSDEFLPAAKSLIEEAHRKWPDNSIHIPLEREQQTLSPSDFGFHNMIRKKDGSLSFFDFEYFGWDDPVKLVSDFSFHPGMKLTDGEVDFWLRGAEKIYGEQITKRLQASRPLYGLVWCLILINDFRPEIWERRLLADKSKKFSRTETLDRQLNRSRSLLHTIQRTTSLSI
jgi:thiamine kinase-like enzyme